MTDDLTTPNDTMSLLDHLRELRMRMVKVSVAVLVGMIAGFLVVTNSDLIPYMIRYFVGEQGVQITEVTEGFTSLISLSLSVGIMFAMPVLVYQALAFLTPGLNPNERKWIYLGLPLVTLFFIGGLAFGWFITAPAAIHFLVDFGAGVSSDLIENKPKLRDFLSILTRLLLISGIVFELPIIMFTLAKLHIIDPRKIAQYRRYIILAVVIIAAIITPTPDPGNLFLVAVPMYMLFELGLLLGRLA